MRLLVTTTCCLVAAIPLGAQRAQLGRKGRQPERGAAPAIEPIRRLPRRGAPAAVSPAPAPAPEELRANLPVRATPPDRLRPLVRRIPETAPAPPLPAVAEDATLYPRPRRALIPAMVARAPVTPPEVSPVPNRWGILLPSWRRYSSSGIDAPYAVSRWWDPFNRNTIKGDYPIVGRHTFLDLSASSETLAESRRIPVPSVPSSAEPGEFGFFGRGEQFAVRENFRVSMDLFRGAAGFRPVDYELRFTPEFNVNYLLARETGLTRIDVRQGIRRVDTNVGIQEMFFEKRLFTNSASAFRPRSDTDARGSAYFDFTSLRFGIQRFTSDFRGFIFADEQPGARLFGTFRNNVFQYNLAYFNMLEKDTNSGLNRWRSRRQSVYVANLYWTDAFTPGYNLNFSVLFNNDQPTFLLDKNGFLVRPAPIGLPAAHKIRVGYAGISGDGHIGRINISHAFYDAFGRDDQNPIPSRNRAQHIQAQLAAAEVSYDKDWMTWKASFFFTSGDKDINDGRATGFDAIVPNQQFAGGGFLGSGNLADRGLINPLFEGGGVNFLNREFIPLTGTGVTLFGPNSLIPSMRAGLFEGQANFVNPGIMLANAGMDAKVTPKLVATANVNYSRFVRTEPLKTVLFQSSIRHSIGVDSGIGLKYRPLLSDNIVVIGGVSALFPQGGFKDIYTGRTLFSGFLNLRLLF
jgi:hypothetical protein